AAPARWGGAARARAAARPRHGARGALSVRRTPGARDESHPGALPSWRRASGRDARRGRGAREPARRGHERTHARRAGGVTATSPAPTATPAKPHSTGRSSALIAAGILASRLLGLVRQKLV